MALAETAQLVAELTLRDHLSGSVGKVNSSLSKLQGGAGQAGKGLGQLAGGLTRVGVVAAGAAATGIGATLKLAGNFEAQLNTINTVAQVTPTQLQKIGDSVRGLARDTGTPLSDLTGAYYDLVSAGVSAADAQNVLTQANTLAIGGLGSTAETVDLLTTAINSYGGDASKAKEYTDQFAVAIANGKVTAAELAASFAEVGPLAAAMGVGVDQISASIGNMTAKGTHAPEAFTQIRAAMVALQRQTPELKAVMKDLGITNIQTELDSKGLAGTWDELRAQAEKAGIPIIKLTGRVEGQQYVLQNTGDALDDYQKNLKDVQHASDGTGVAAQQMAERQKGLNFQLGRLKALAQDAGITIGSKLLPKFVPLVEKLNTFISNNQDKIGKFGDELASGFGKFADKLKDADFSGLIDGLKMMSTIGKGVVDLFMSLPPQVQAIAVAGLSLNKISGGLLGKGAGNLIGGLIKIGFERGSSPANPLFVADVAGGGGGAPGVNTPGFRQGILDVLKIAIPLAVAAAAVNEVVSGREKYSGQNQSLADLGLTSDEITAAKVNVGSAAFRQGVGRGGHVVTQAQIDSATAKLKAKGFTLHQLPDGSFELVPIVSSVADPLAGSPAHFKGAAAQAAAEHAPTTTAQTLANLGFTPNMGPKDRAPILEQGRRTGTDLFGEQALAVFRQAANPKAPPIMGEISRHITELKDIEKTYLREGNLAAANHAQKVREQMAALIGATASVPPALEKARAADNQHASQNAARTAAAMAASRADARGIQAAADRAAAATQRQDGPLSALVAGANATASHTDDIRHKNFSPTVDVGVNVTTNVTVNSVTRKIVQMQRAAGRGFTATGLPA